MSAQLKELPPMSLVQRASTALRSTEHEAKLKELADASKSITAITNSDGYQQCHASRMSLKNMRITIQRTGKEARDDATKFSKAVIAEEDRLIQIIEPEEKRLAQIQDAYDAEVEAEKQRRIDAEIARVKDIQERIAEIRGCPAACASSKSEVIAEHISDIDGIVIDESFAEFQQEAGDAKAVTLANLHSLHSAALDREAERIELQRLRVEQAKRDEEARLARIEEERKAKEIRDAEIQRQNEELRKQREENDRIARENAATAKAAQDKLDEQAAALAAQQAELDRQQQVIRDREAAAEAERQAAAQKVIDDENARAAAEQQRLDNEAAAAREAEQKKADDLKAKQAAKRKRPSAQEIIGVLAAHYKVSDSKVIEWLKTLDLELAA